MTEKTYQNGTKAYSNDKFFFVSLKKIIDEIKAGFGKNKSNEEDRVDYSRVPILIIDEIGVNYGTESERIELFDLFNTRWENMLPTVCISNLNRKEIVKILGQRITDRLFDNAVYVEITGQSRRG